MREQERGERVFAKKGNEFFRKTFITRCARQSMFIKRKKILMKLKRRLYVRADSRRIRVRNNKKKRPSLTSHASREDACLVDLSTIETRRFVRKDGSSGTILSDRRNTTSEMRERREEEGARRRRKRA